MPAEIAIYQDIDSASGFGPQALRDGLAQAAGEPVEIRLNSEGGNVIDGLACYNILRSYPGKKTVVIDGMALSIASLIACAGDQVQMAENAWFMVHNPHNQAHGDGDDLREMAGLLDGMRDQLATVYMAKTKKPREEILALMAAETWMTGPQAKEAGFVDEVTASLAIAAEFDASRFSRPPKIQKEDPAMSAATYQELKKAFPKAKADFLTRCLDKEVTLEKARAEYDETMAKSLEETTEELAKARAQIEEMQKEQEAKAKAEEEEKDAAEAKAKAKAEEDEEKKAAEARAKAGVKAAAGGSGKGGASGATARDRFDDAVTEQIKGGMARAQAIATIIRRDPGLQREMIEEHNAAVGPSTFRG